MERIGIRELRDTLTTTIRRVRLGERLEVTHDGVVVALLIPVPRDRIGRLLARGDVHPRTPLAAPVEALPVTGAMTASEALAEDRGD